MKRIKIMGLALVAIFSLTAVFAGSAFATSLPQTLIFTNEAHEPLPTGTVIVSESTNLKTVLVAATLECSENVLPAATANNSSLKVTAVATLDEAFGTESGLIEGVEQKNLCKTSTPGLDAAIVTKGFPWNFGFTAKLVTGAATGKGTEVTKGSKKIEFTSKFTGQPVNHNYCVFEGSTIKSTFTTGTPGKPLPLEFKTTNQNFNVNASKSNSETCGSNGKLSGTWTVKVQGTGEKVLVE